LLQTISTGVVSTFCEGHPSSPLMTAVVPPPSSFTSKCVQSRFWCKFQNGFLAHLNFSFVPQVACTPKVPRMYRSNASDQLFWQTLGFVPGFLICFSIAVPWRELSLTPPSVIVIFVRTPSVWATWLVVYSAQEVRPPGPWHRSFRNIKRTKSPCSTGGSSGPGSFLPRVCCFFSLRPETLSALLCFPGSWSWGCWMPRFLPFRARCSFGVGCVLSLDEVLAPEMRVCSHTVHIVTTPVKTHFFRHETVN
jgi:hypothetical protein